VQIEINSQRELNYKAGDIGVVYPSNSEESVECIMKLMNLNNFNFVEIKHSFNKPDMKTQEKFPKIINARELVKKFFKY